VRVAETGTKLLDDVEVRLDRERRRGLHPRGEAVAAQELHHDEGRGAVVRELENGDDVAVLELGDGARLAEEPRPQLLDVVGEVPDHHLDRHLTIEHRIDAAVEHPHAAAPDAFENLITANLRGAVRRGRRSRRSGRWRRLRNQYGRVPLWRSGRW